MSDFDSAMTIEDKLQRAEERLGYQFANRVLLRRCLTHASAADTRADSNERLEFLGDAILDSIICESLFHDRPDDAEGDLTRVKSAVVSRRECARVCRRLQLTECLIVGRGVSRHRQIPTSIEAGAIEALIAGIYLDGGFRVVQTCILGWFAESLRSHNNPEETGNFKSQLQQLVQQAGLNGPLYRVLDEQGPDHSKCFQVAAVSAGRVFPAAWGASKKKAEQRAAANAVAILQQQPIPYPVDATS